MFKIGKSNRNQHSSAGLIEINALSLGGDEFSWNRHR